MSIEPLRVAVQMDHISTVQITGDSTFAIMLEAQARGHELFHYEVGNLAMRDGVVSAPCEPVQVRDEEGNHFTLGEAKREDLASMDVIHMRQDPPFHMGYITATHLLERIHGEGPGKTLVVNNPAEVRNAPEKIFVTEFPDLMPETLISRAPDDIRAFYKEFGDIIVKPLYGNGGAGVFRVQPGDQNLSSLIEMFHEMTPEPMIAQRYMSEVRAGDKRIILVDGEAVGAINRIPGEDEARSNMHVGGRAEAIGMTEREHEICARIGPELKRRGFIFVGIDVIGDYMTEINVTSPTGIREVKKFGGADIAALLWDAIEAKKV
ncbi:glutathione synthase [Ahrensia sp. R2A130]|uniref:glutathione synthase n=1 Tax=Ahrensia sp. R2A130 TaxID=744979 RepID=UPI0001E0D837|nr:glutathione synthase [Ahrensia sp. R2A130]EFL89800.1 glutathione synthase [Ahrensia sp. R2A130]